MAVSTLDATAKGASANSFATRDAANQYFEDRPGSSSWSSASNDQKDQALLFATKLLNKNYRFKGEKTTTTQSLAWPRKYVPDPDPDIVYTAENVRLRDVYMDDDVIPDRVKFATYEQALALIKDSSRVEDPGLQQFDSLRIEGVVTMQVNSNKLPKQIARAAREFIQPFLRFEGRPFIIRT